MDTSPDRTFALLKPYKSASSTSDAAKLLARATLSDPERTEFDLLIERFKAAAEERNKVQHGLWAARAAYPDSLARVSALEYTKFTVSIAQADDPVRDADRFSASLRDNYDLGRLSKIASVIEALTTDIIVVTNRFLAGKLSPSGPA